MIRHYHLRRQICRVGKRLYERGFVASNDGNISARIGDPRILITPTGVSKGCLRSARLVSVDFEGNARGRLRPSSEFRMHLEIYRQRPDVRAVVHAHTPFATAWAVSGRELPADVLPEILLTLGKLPTVPYENPSSQTLADAVGRAARAADALLLQNHGVVTLAEDLWTAYYHLERVEHVSKILYHAAQLGPIEAIPRDKLTELMELFPISSRIREDINSFR